MVSGGSILVAGNRFACVTFGNRADLPNGTSPPPRLAPPASRGILLRQLGPPAPARMRSRAEALFRGNENPPRLQAEAVTGDITEVAFKEV
jgi:hypothetical protein